MPTDGGLGVEMSFFDTYKKKALKKPQGPLFFLLLRVTWLKIA
jgi:hypothetical protein